MRKLIPLYKNLVESRANFEVKCTNSFYEIKHGGTSFKFFSGAPMNFKLIHLANRIKKEAENNAYVTPSENSIQEYFKINHNFDFDINEKFYCVDIKKAYVSFLRNKKIISEKLYNDICNLKKADRLRVVGMLARKKFRYVYTGGIMHASEMKIQPTEKYFFWCVEKTYLLMSDIAKKIDSDFVFFWVDCIFFCGEKNINYVIDRLKSERLGFTLERFRVNGISELKNYFNYNLNKSGKMKDYNIPKFSKIDIFNKARNCFVNSDFNGFKYYFNEFNRIFKE